MNKKIIGVIILFLGLIIIAGIVYVLFFSGFDFKNSIPGLKQEEVISNEVNNSQTNQSNKQVPVFQVRTKEPKKIIMNNNGVQGQDQGENVLNNDVKKSDLIMMASLFTERFGSYSNQSNFSNISDLKMFMSFNMKKWADKHIKEQQERGLIKDIYYGITTKAINEEIQEYDEEDGQVIILVKTRRREATISMNNTTKVFDQDIKVYFVKENGAWKVNKANWQDK